MSSDLNPLTALLLGLVQGFTEFLPISSSGHLVLAQYLLGFKEAPLLFDIVIHAGTLVSVVVFFRHRLTKLNKNYLLLLVIGTLPAVIFGLFFYDYIEYYFQSLVLLSLGFLVSAILIFITKYAKVDNKPLTARVAFIIGLAQALAIIPSISRSGSTVAVSLLKGISKSTAFEFSFLLSIPAIAGALILELTKIHNLNEILAPSYLIGFMAAALTGFGSLVILKRIIVANHLFYFSYYLIIMSVISFVLFLTSTT